MPEGVEDRDADVWESLLAVADAIGGEWPRKGRDAAVSLVSDAKEIEPSLGIRLLSDCKNVFLTELMPTTTLLKALHDLSESPWNDLKGKPLNDRSLAVRLRQYGIKSKQIRIGDMTCKGYTRADFIDLWERYLTPASDRSETSETSETTQEFQELNVSDVSDVSDDVSDVSRNLTAKSTDKTGTASDVSLVSLVGEGIGVPSDYAAVIEERAARGDRTRVTIREIRVPAIAAGIDDDLEEIDPRWAI
jgi:hypothetical protein